MFVGEWSLGEISIGKMSVGRISVGEMSGRRNVYRRNVCRQNVQALPKHVCFNLILVRNITAQPIGVYPKQSS